MADGGSWFDPGAVLGGTGLLAGVGAVIKTILDWRKDSGKLTRDSEGEIRDDLRAEISRQGEEILTLRRELAESRREMREITAAAQHDIEAWQQRAAALQSELSELKAELRVLRTRVSDREHWREETGHDER